ncbi:hypothetical protein [Flavobacterium sp. W21_SRS_FM6]
MSVVAASCSNVVNLRCIAGLGLEQVVDEVWRVCSWNYRLYND